MRITISGRPLGRGDAETQRQTRRRQDRLNYLLALRVSASDSVSPPSYLKATTGSSFAALFAGQIPKNSPTPTDITIPVAAAHSGTDAGSELNTVRAISEIIHPKM